MAIALFRCSVGEHSAATSIAFFLFLILVWQVFFSAVQAAEDKHLIAGIYRGQSKNWDVLRQNFKLLNDESATHIIAFSSGFNQQYFKVKATLIQRYQGYINAEVLQRNFPAEIALLPLIESGLNINALSAANAVGPWQFMAGTAREYGITINHEFDGRKDIVQSTEAALNYLEMLYRKMNDWLLVIAAYNAGEGRVRKALKKVPRGQPINFWQLDLPDETKKHVSQVLALSRVIQSPARFGVSLPSLSDSIVLLLQPHRKTFDQLALNTGASSAELRQLNAAFTSDWFDPGYQQGIYITERMPIMARVNCQSWSHQYIVKPGDSLFRIASQYRTTIHTLKSCNTLRGSLIRTGQSLSVPVVSG